MPPTRFLYRTRCEFRALTIIGQMERAGFRFLPSTGNDAPKPGFAFSEFALATGNFTLTGCPAVIAPHQ